MHNRARTPFNIAIECVKIAKYHRLMSDFYESQIGNSIIEECKIPRQEIIFVSCVKIHDVINHNYMDENI